MMIQRHPVWPLIGFLFLLSLNGCESLGTKLGATKGDTRYGADQLPKQWTAEGKLSVSANQKRQSASFRWEQNGTDYKVHLFGFLGQGSTWLKKKGKTVTLENAELGIQKASTAEALMAEYLGWQLPIDAMRYWMFAKQAPQPQPISAETDASGRLQTLSQNGWKIDYTRYQTDTADALPAKMTLQHQSLEAIVVVKSWQF